MVPSAQSFLIFSREVVDVIRLSNGHAFEYMAASGALGYDGQGWPWEQPLRLLGMFEPRLFTAVTKTLTPQPVRGHLRWTHPWNCVCFIPDGVVNAIGLSNPGFGWWNERVEPRLSRSPVPIIVSITADDIDQLALMAARLNHGHIVGIEFNPSCPNTGADLLPNLEFILNGCAAIKRKTNLPLLLKLSVVHPAELILPHLYGLVEALSVNSVPWSAIYPSLVSPLARLGGGGVSGGAAQVHTWGYARRLARLTNIPVIGPSVWWFDDLQSLRAMGMKAVSFGSLFLRYPWKPTLYVRRDKAIDRRHFRQLRTAAPLHT